MALATKCPHCNTIFRVAADQLKLRGGIVRCGSCHEVFDGNAALVEPAPKPTTVIPDVPVATAAAAAGPAAPAISSYVRGSAVDFELDLAEDAAPAPSAAPAVWRTGGPAHPSPEEQAEAAVARAFAAVTAHANPETTTPPWDDALAGDAAIAPPAAALPVDGDEIHAAEAPQPADADTSSAAPHDNAPDQPYEVAATSGDGATPHGDDALPPGDAGDLPSEVAGQSGDSAAEQGDDALLPADHSDLPSEVAGHSGDSAAAQGEDALQPADDGDQPSKAAAQSGDGADHPTVVEAPHVDDTAQQADGDDAILQAEVSADLPAGDEPSLAEEAAPADGEAPLNDDPASQPADDSDGGEPPAETPSDAFAAPDPDFVPAFLRARPAPSEGEPAHAAGQHPDGRIEPTLDTPQEHIVAAALDDSHHFEDIPPAEQPAAETASPAADEPWSLAEPRDDTALHAVAAVNTDAPDDGASLPDDEPASDNDNDSADDRRERALERAQDREAADARMRALAGVDETPAEDLDHSDLSFVKRHDRSQKYGRAMKIVMAFSIPLLLGGLVLQAATTFRDTLAASYPQLKPALAALCQPLGCQVGLPTQLDALSIEQGELASMAANTFSFSTVLRNQSKTVQAWPHIELTLNDNADKPVVRRVFAPREYLPSATEADKGFLPRSEQSIKLYFELKELKASGYHIAIFYP